MRNCPLFLDIDGGDLSALLKCLSAENKAYNKGGFIIRQEEKLSSVGVVLSGRVHIIKDDYFGNRNILSEICAGGLFGEAVVCAGTKNTPIGVLAAEQAEILLLDYGKIVETCRSACSFHSALIKNMLRILAKKNLTLVDKLEHITKRTTGEKIISYLSEQARLKGGPAFDVPFDRQELADYLSVERSALSAELSKLRKQGFLKFNKNSFELTSG